MPFLGVYGNQLLTTRLNSKYLQLIVHIRSPRSTGFRLLRRMRNLPSSEFRRSGNVIVAKRRLQRVSPRDVVSWPCEIGKFRKIWTRSFNPHGR
ncbi:hypothetical protein WAI453_000396 [Rhynchosporium graminicola]